jgi:hypothetical protein
MPGAIAREITAFDATEAAGSFSNICSEPAWPAAQIEDATGQVDQEFCPGRPPSLPW